MNTTVNGRYQLKNMIGAGGMGSVYCATDRLTGETVALKQVTIPMFQLFFNTDQSLSSTRETLNIALANEFRTLAALHHPHIIRVLDYGFDAQQQPFYTMRFLSNAQTLLEAGQTETAESKVRLLQQLLQALIYLHRQGVLHRDLKPANVLVQDGNLYVLDFGLSTHKRAQVSSSVGSWRYVAPEIFDDAPASEQSDLYGVGVMAYELFVGRHPLDGVTTDDPVAQIQGSRPDTTPITQPAIRAIIDTLLEKNPQDRYPNARRVFVAFNQALGLALPAEDNTIRESFLQSAAFVGRNKEIATLREAMDQAKINKGSAWLITGESGVGKSRLLRELDTYALVGGFIVLRGQAIAERTGQLLQLWREPLRRLLLHVTPSPLALGVLQTIMPDLATLVGESIPAPPPLDEPAMRQRLYGTIVGLFQQVRQPIMLILEDLHWGEDDFALLTLLAQQAQGWPLLIIGSCRDDEGGGLAQRLPMMQMMALPRLSDAHVAQLSQTMLGKVGERPDVLALLQRETEGNTFFLVEVVRALAERSGALATIGEMVLPEKIMPQGIQSIVQRRLARIPAGGRTLLQLMAIAGRQLDLTLAHALNQQTHIENEWLPLCAEYAILEIHEGTWQFAHDKMRDGLVASLTSADLARFNRQVAEGVESLYPDNPSYAARLMQYWGEAGRLDKEKRYAFVAGRYAAGQYANADAVRFFSRALALSPTDDGAERYKILLDREKIFALMGERDEQQVDLASLASCAELLRPGQQIEVKLRQAAFAIATGSYADAISTAAQVIAHTSDVSTLATAHRHVGIALRWQSDVAESEQHLLNSLHYSEMAGDRPGQSRTLLELGVLSFAQRDHQKAHDFYQQSLIIAQDIAHKQSEGLILNRLGVIADRWSNYGQAQTYYDQSLKIARQIGDRHNEGGVLINMGNMALSQGALDVAQTSYQQALLITQLTNDRRGEALIYANLDFLMGSLGRYAEAQTNGEQGLAIAKSLGAKGMASTFSIGVGIALTHQNAFAEAETYFAEAYARAQGLNSVWLDSYVRTKWANLAFRQGDLPRAKQLYSEALTLLQTIDFQPNQLEAQAGLACICLEQAQLEQALRHIEPIVAHVTVETLSGNWEPFQTALAAYQVLQTVNDSRATPFLATLHQALQNKATRIADPITQQAFLQNVSAHKALIDLAEQAKHKLSVEFVPPATRGIM